MSKLHVAFLDMVSFLSGFALTYGVSHDALLAAGIGGGSYLMWLLMSSTTTVRDY